MSRTGRNRTRSRAESKQATHEALIAAGVAMISEHGLDVSLDAICARAKLTRGAFYVHFADRDAFLLAVMQHVLGGFVTRVAGAAAGSADGEAPTTADAIRGFLAAVGTPALHPAQRAPKAPRFHQVMEACRRAPQIGDAYRRLVVAGRDRIAALVAGDRRDARIRGDVEPEAVADLLAIFALGIATALELEIPVAIDRAGASLLTLLGGKPHAPPR